MRDKGNPIEILEKPHNLRTIPVTPKILEKTSQSADNPRDPWKSWKKPHNLSPILAPAPGTPGNPGKNLTICGPSPGPPEILEKTSQSADHPLDLRKSWKKTSQYYGFACCWLVVVGCCWLFRQAVQRPPVGAMTIVHYAQLDEMHLFVDSKL